MLPAGNIIGWRQETRSGGYVLVLNIIQQYMATPSYNMQYSCTGHYRGLYSFKPLFEMFGCRIYITVDKCIQHENVLKDIYTSDMTRTLKHMYMKSKNVFRVTWNYWLSVVTWNIKHFFTVGITTTSAFQHNIYDFHKVFIVFHTVCKGNCIQTKII